jgi:Cu(I)-responsive transcriptional regulator
MSDVMEPNRLGASGAMTIGEAAVASGVSPKMIRYYERIGLVPPAPRRGSGYRLYGPEDVRVLRFVGRARELGFPLRTVAELLALWRDRGRSNAEVRHLARRHAEDLRRHVAELEGMIAALDHLVATCAGDGRSDCPILDDLAGPRGAETADAEADPARI